MFPNEMEFYHFLSPRDSLVRQASGQGSGPRSGSPAPAPQAPAGHAALRSVREAASNFPSGRSSQGARAGTLHQGFPVPQGLLESQREPPSPTPNTCACALLPAPRTASEPQAWPPPPPRTGASGPLQRRAGCAGEASSPPGATKQNSPILPRQPLTPPLEPEPPRNTTQHPFLRQLSNTECS